MNDGVRWILVVPAFVAGIILVGLFFWSIRLVSDLPVSDQGFGLPLMMFFSSWLAKTSAPERKKLTVGVAVSFWFCLMLFSGESDSAYSGFIGLWWTIGSAIAVVLAFKLPGIDEWQKGYVGVAPVIEGRRGRRVRLWRCLVLRRLSSRYLAVLIFSGAAFLCAFACESIIEDVEGPDVAVAVIDVDELPLGGQVVAGVIQGLHDRVVPRALKASDVSVCAYREESRGSVKTEQCWTLERWDENPALQIILLSWFYSIGLAGLYLALACLGLRGYFWVSSRIEWLKF